MKPSCLLLWLLTACVIPWWPGRVHGAMHSFAAGSLIIPVDPCWQPAGEQAVAVGCSAGGSLAGVAGAYGLAYRLQGAGVPVFQAESGPLGDGQSIAFVIQSAGQAPVTLQPGGSPLDPPPRNSGATALAAHLVEYRGQPFLVDAGAMGAISEAILADYPGVRWHQARLPFSAPVARVLTGLPTHILVTEPGAAATLSAAVTLAGLSGPGGLEILTAGSPVPTTGDVPLSGCSAAATLVATLDGPCGMPALLNDLTTVPSTTPPRETVTVAPLVTDGILYAASTEFPGSTGHLRAYTLSGSRPTRLWDAAAGIPLPGVGLPPTSDPGITELAPQFTQDPAQRVIFTNLDASRGFRLVSFEAAAAFVLQPLLGVGNVTEAAALINAVRGRSGTTPAAPVGQGDRAVRLGGISRSTPAVVGGSPLVEAAARREQILYVGGEDGLLHAVVVGQWLAATGGYEHAGGVCGRELWAYLPGSFLAALVHQPLTSSTRLPSAHVDGAPVVSDLFIDGDGDGRREWRTILVGTATDQQQNRGVVFALDVTEPLAPRLLWEKPLLEIDLGPSRGAVIGWVGTWADSEPRVFLTAGRACRHSPDGSVEAVNGQYGVLACALNLSDGSLLWQFAAPYPGTAMNLAEPPSPPALMNAAAGGGVDGLVFGDLAGRLWVLALETGAPLGGGPAWQAPGGAAEPIVGGIALRSRLALFGTGGVAYAGRDGRYAVYAVEILPEGGRLLWSQALLPGEKVWGQPSFDRFGRAYLGVGANDDASGRLLMITADGDLLESAALNGAPLGGVTLAPGAILAITRAGEARLYGEVAAEPPPAGASAGRVRVFSWRVR